MFCARKVEIPIKRTAQGMPYRKSREGPEAAVRSAIVTPAAGRDGVCRYQAGKDAIDAAPFWVSSGRTGSGLAGIMDTKGFCRPSFVRFGLMVAGEFSLVKAGDT